MTARENQNAVIYSGDKVSLKFPVDNGAGAPAVLTAPTGTWNLAPGVKTTAEAAHVLTKAIRFATETIGAASYTVAYVDLLEADTTSLVGEYQMQLRITDNATPLMAAAGALTIKRRIP